MKRNVFAALMLCAGVAWAGIDDPNDPYWADGELVDLAVDASGVDAGTIIDGILKGLEMVELKTGYQSPIGQAERAKIIESVTARHGKIWIPRKLSTVIGSSTDGNRFRGLKQLKLVD